MQLVNILGRRSDNGEPIAVRCDNVGRLDVALAAVAAVVTVVQPTHDLLNANATLQIADVDVSNANPVPVSDAGGSLTVDQATHDNLNANANMQVGDVDVANGNPVPVSDAGGTLTVDQATHDLLNANANMQVGDVDVSWATNPIPTTSPIEITVTPTITAGAYAAADALGGLLTFANAVLGAGRSAVITKVVITDDADQAAPIDLVLFDQTFTNTADNAPFDPSDADLQNCIGYIDVAATDYASFVDNGVAAKSSGLRMPFPVTLVGTSLFGQMRVQSAPTYVATDDITIKLTIERL